MGVGACLRLLLILALPAAVALALAELLFIKIELNKCVKSFESVKNYQSYVSMRVVVLGEVIEGDRH